MIWDLPLRNFLVVIISWDNTKYQAFISPVLISLINVQVKMKEAPWRQNIVHNLSFFLHSLKENFMQSKVKKKKPKVNNNK